MTINCGYTEFYFVRHGESQGNVANLLQGWGDTSLSETGRAQATAAAAALEGVELDAAYASSLRRACETAQFIVTRHPGLELQKEDGLREWWLGELEDRPQDELNRDRAELMYRFGRECGEIEVPGGESKSAFQHRISTTLDRIARRHVGQRVLLVSHGWAAHRVFAHVYGDPAPGRRFPIPDNASISVFRFFPEDGSWLMVAWNRNEHLAGLPIRHNLFA